ncbi:50S ribosomal protein L15 [Caldicellulosiruptor morganii]|uniref:Large ribosomal subunit protein uL15 n=1 Tax=Caldicellulosiruptor morganii TaxID=1387555 RepID=A0ABY7BSP0_9FIRM|nr:50S ribosomal protein L15 [Caldicellulosiruptor morganii]WAM34659.1 50S ribosomal protein L15 [Caldicellulosiruptor morganii]
MKLYELRPAPGAKKKPKRVGRGESSGHGKTSTRGHKGQWARSGGGVRPGFEGGQMPLTRRIPKRGFKNINKKVYTEVNVEKLERFDNDTVITPELLLREGVISKIEKDGVKVLGRGKLTKRLIVRVQKVSEGARKKIETAGGKVEVI